MISLTDLHDIVLIGGGTATGTFSESALVGFALDRLGFAM